MKRPGVSGGGLGTGAEPSVTLRLEELRGSRHRRLREDSIALLLLAAALTSLLVSILITWSLVREASTFIVEVDWRDTWTIGWFPRRGFYDLRTLLYASAITTGIAMIVAVPLGLGAAVYLSEYARPRVRAVVKPALEVLAGIPSVVLGFFALAWIAPVIVARLNADANGGSLFAAGIGVGILVVPLITSVSEDAMRAVPSSLREAAAGLGARKSATTLRVVIPASVSGLVAAAILAISRALGETMVVFLAGGAGDTAVRTIDPFEGSLTLTAAMASLARGTDQVVGEGLTFQSLFFVGLVLFLLTLALNLAADAVVTRLRNRY